MKKKNFNGTSFKNQRKRITENFQIQYHGNTNTEMEQLIIYGNIKIGIKKKKQ